MAPPAETNSLEVRWFDAGPPPTSLTDWVTGLGDVTTATRTDLYLSPPAPAVNVKLRGGDAHALEIKQRLAALGSHAFGPAVTGRLEQWYKWRFSLSEAPALWDADRSGLWHPVEKTRLLVRLDDDHPVLAERLSEAGVTAHAEVTAVEAGDTSAWTCGLEATGPPTQLVPSLRAVGDALFDEAFPLSLDASQSVGYSAWLGAALADDDADPSVLTSADR
ncbi:hypothetical protein ACFQGE_13655 [Halomicroarcula sp. GCM10025817]|uniref:hypothetical protein n=1 Tax=Haloarcula TaxID=2237 RepID=UPI0023E82B23|nr:hypothetical protein [Halomicroarcula sp. SYNS111]